MYNRYIRNDHGVYTRVSVSSAPAEEVRAPSPPPVREEKEAHHEGGESERYVNQKHHDEDSEKKGSSSLPLGGFVERILGKFNLQDVDTGDIILLFLLFLLFEEKADEELLFALGLLLIL